MTKKIIYFRKYSGTVRDFILRTEKLGLNRSLMAPEALKMRSLVGIMFIGWCLTSCKWMPRGQYLPKPSISVSPSVVVPVGENITIRCKSEEKYLPERFILLCKGKSGYFNDVNSQVVERDEAVFHIVRAEPSDAGIYGCIFQSKHQQWSVYSDEVHIMIKEVFYPKPFISVDPKGVVPLGAHVSIQCNSTEYRQAEFYLLKEGSPEPTQIKMVDGEATVFSISSVKLSDGGIYWCEYRDRPTLGDQYSHASDQVYIYVTDPSLPKPIIQMKPKGQHGLGANVTIHCEGPENGLTFSLYTSLDMVASKTVNPNRNKTAFSIPMVSLEDAGRHTCRYQSKGNPYVWSEPSMPVQLIVKDGSLSKPSIKVRSTERTPRGMNITIECLGPEEDLNFSLFKFKVLIGSQIEQKRQIAKFHVFIKASEKPKEYTCQYHRKENPFVWSESSDPLKLTPGDRFPTTMWAGVAAGSLLVVLLLFFLIVLYRKKRKRSIANDGTQPVNMPQEAEAGEDPSEAGEDPNEVSYAVLNLDSLNIKQATNLNSNPDSCVYAVVAKNIIRESP